MLISVLLALYILVVPGFLLTKLLFAKLEGMELCMLSIALSLVFLVLVGLLLGSFGAINAIALWLMYGLSTAVLLIFYVLRR